MTRHVLYGFHAVTVRLKTAPDTVWVGTGEANNQRSSYAGIGVFKSSDGGRSWSFMGLPESHHIGRIAIHPGNPDVVYVAALGHLYSPNAERGLYRTRDGGRSFETLSKGLPQGWAYDLVYRHALDLDASGVPIGALVTWVGVAVSVRPGWLVAVDVAAGAEKRTSAVAAPANRKRISALAG